MHHRRPWALHRSSALVLAIGVGLSVLVLSSSSRSADDDQRRLLEDRAEQVLGLLTSFQGSLEAELATSTAIAEIVDGDPERWATQVSDGADGGGSAFVLFRRTDEGLVRVATAGAAALGPGDSAEATARLEQAAEGSLVVVDLFGEPPLRTLGIAASRADRESEYVTYQEISLVAEAGGEAASEPGLFEDISMALYLGSEPREERKIVGFGEQDPLTVEHAEARTQVGSSDILLVISTSTPLVGGVTPQVPYALFALALAGSVAVTAVVELNLRRRDDTLHSLRDLEQKNRELDDALKSQREGEQERLRLERELRQSQRLEAVGQLAGGVAHDFNNLLAAISSFAELALEDLDGHPSRDDLVEIREAAKRGATLVRQLLMFSRAEPTDATAVDLNRVITEFERLLRRALGEGIELELVLEPDLGCVLGAAGELEQVVMNLAMNARDAMDSHGRITIATSTFAVGEHDTLSGLAPGRYARCTVADDGVGMAPDVVSRAFDPFFTTKARGRGTGLGLSTVYGIVQRAGGRIRIDSEAGVGTIVELVFPRIDARAHESDEAKPAAPDQPRRTATVLLAEDDPAVRASTRRLLERRGFTVIDVASGPEALEQHRLRPVDVLVTDLVMPGGMNGYELAAALQKTQPDLGVVYMSGHSDDPMLSQGPRVDGVSLTKPVTSDTLARAVDSVVGRRVTA